MAEDPRFLLHFKTLAKFKEKLADGTINEERHLVFIKDEKLIWCRGVYYSDASKLDNFSSYYNDWSITLSNASTMTITLKGNKWNETTRKWEAISKALTVNAATSTVSGLMSAQDKRQVDIIDTANFKLEDPTTSATLVVINASHTDVNSETRNLKTSKILTTATSTNAGILTAQDKRLLDIITSANFELTTPTTTANTVVLHTKRTNVNDETDNVADSELETARTIPAATSTKAGVMSATDKTELDRIETANFGNILFMSSVNDSYITATKTKISDGSTITEKVKLPTASENGAGIITAQDKIKLNRIVTTNFNPGQVIYDGASVNIYYNNLDVNTGASTSSFSQIATATIALAGVMPATSMVTITDLRRLKEVSNISDTPFTATADSVTLNYSEVKVNGAINSTNSVVTRNSFIPVSSDTQAGIITAAEHKLLNTTIPTDITNIKNNYLPLSGGTMMGPLTLLSSLWWEAGNCGLNAANSDIIGLNGLYFNGSNNAWGEGILFNRYTAEDKQGSFPYDRLNAYNGELYFDIVTDANSPVNQNKILHLNNYADILDTRYVTLSTSLTITGAKTFTNEIKTSGGINLGATGYSSTGRPANLVSVPGIHGGMGGSDSWVIAAYGSGLDGGYLEIATGDNGNEPIYVSQYNGGPLSTAGTRTHEITLMDGLGNQQFNNVTGTKFIKLGGTNQQFLMADSSVTTKKEASALTHTGHTNAAAGNLMIPTISFITYWNGAYDSSNHSNLRYCFRGLFGDIVTHAHSEYVTALGTSGNYLTWTKNGTANNITVPYATTTSVVSSNGLIAPLTGTNKHGSGIRMYEGYNNGYPSTYGNVLAIQGNTHGGAGELYMSWNGSGNTTPGHLYYRLISDITGSTWSPWVTILDSDNYSTTLDTRYYTKTQIDTNTVKSITMSASVSNTTGTPSVSVTKGGTTANPTYSFAFSGIKGEKGDKGDTGPRGATGATGPLGPAGSDASISESDRRLLSGHFPLYFSDTEAPDGIDIIAYARNCSINPKLGVIYLQPGTVDLEKHWAEYRGSGIYLANNGNNSPTETLTIERSKIIADPNFTIQSDSIDIIASEDILTQSRSTISILTPKFILTTGSLDWEFTNNVYSNNLTYKYNDGFTWESDHAEYFQVKSSTTGVGLACTQNSTFISAYYAEPDKSGMQYRRKIPDEHGYAVSYVFCGENLEIWCINEITANKTITVSSDRNLKQNILDISDNILDSLSNIKYKQFEYKESKDNRPQYGVIALEVLEADIPGIVSKSEKSEYYYVNYNSLYALEIANLKKQVKELQDVVNQLKSIILDNI